MPGLVDQRGVGRRPRHVVERGRAGRRKRTCSSVGEDAPGRRGDQPRRAEEVVQELVRRQSGPHPVERLGQLGDPPDLTGEVLEVELVLGQFRGVLVARERHDRARGAGTERLLGLTGPVGQELGHGRFDQAAAGVVAAGSAADDIDDLAAVLGGRAGAAALRTGSRRRRPGPAGGS